MAMALRLEGSQADMRHLDLWGHGRPVPARRDAPHGAAGAVTSRMASDISHRSDAVDQAKRLKLAAIFFTVFWIGGMLWWSGEYHPAYIILLAVCGALGGYLWYLAMRRVFSHMHQLPRNGDHGGGRETP
jgi:hypothetical protein